MYGQMNLCLLLQVIDTCKMNLWSFPSLNLIHLDKNNVRIGILMTIFQLIIMVTCTDASCPVSCQCESVSVDSKGLLKVTCSHQELKTFPSISVDTNSLNISHNAIGHLTHVNNLNILTFTHIRVMDVSYNDLSSIDQEFFTKFPMLESLNLSGNKLKEVHADLPKTLKVLELNSNYLTSVKDLGTFPQLQALYLAKNYLVNFDLNTENNRSVSSTGTSTMILPKLEILDLANNKLKQINTQLVGHFNSLKYLTLSHNDISQIGDFSIKEGQFDLEILDLSHNSLSSIPKGSFEKMDKLKYLSLAYNFISTIPKGIPAIEWCDLSYNQITSIVESKTSIYVHDVLLLGGNPLHCDCHLQWLKYFYNTRKYLLKYIEVGRDKFIPKCASPQHLSGKTWDLLNSDDFLCMNVPDDEHADSTLKGDNLISLEASQVGPTSITLKWETSAEVNNDNFKIKYHQFGKKKSFYEVHMTASKNKYTLKHLVSHTAYVICIKPLTDVQEVYQDCIEAITLEDSTIPVWLPTGWLSTLIIMTALFLLILALFVRCWKQTDMIFQTPRHLLEENNTKKNQ